MMGTTRVTITYLTNIKFSFLQSTRSLYCQMFHNYLTVSDAYLQTGTGTNCYMKTTKVENHADAEEYVLYFNFSSLPLFPLLVSNCWITLRNINLISLGNMRIRGEAPYKPQVFSVVECTDNATPCSPVH